VKQVQQALSLRGVDGIFGGETETAVKQFQASHGLHPVDGLVGEDTLRELGLDIALLQRPATGVQAATPQRFLQGIDVFELNLNDAGAPAWSAMPPARFSFVLHKAAEFRKDGAFTARWPALAAAGLLRGAWYFPRPDSTANFTKLDAQVDIFVDLVGRLVPGDFGPMLDLVDQLDPHKPNIGLFDDSNEVRNARYWVDAIKHLLERLETAMGRQPAIYTSRRWWHSFTNDAPGFEHYPLWVSDINHASPVLPVPWTKWRGTGSSCQDSWTRTDVPRSARPARACVTCHCSSTARPSWCVIRAKTDGRFGRGRTRKTADAV
jgi:peptidoglycan hydrolase-like protein with peptidoglycan-binding domain